MDLKNLFSILLLIQPPVSSSEKIISFTGAFIGILFLAVINVALFPLVAMLFNKLAPGRRYPIARREISEGKETKSPGWALGRMALSQDDLEAALKDMNAYIDVTREDLGEIYTKAALHAMRRRMGEIHCRDIMKREVATAEYASELEEIWELMRQRKLKGIPVIDRTRRVIGIVTIIDILKRAGVRPTGHVFDRLRQAIRRTPGSTADKPEVVGEIMSAPPITAFEDQHIVTLIPVFSEHKIHHLPIVNQENKLVGMVTQTD